MRRPRLITVFFVLLAAGCGDERTGPRAADPSFAQVPLPNPLTERARIMDDVSAAIAIVRPTQGRRTGGLVRFEQTPAGVHVTGEVGELAPQSRHAFAIHEFGDCTSPTAASAGERYAPGREPHALPPERPRQAGDLGNITADERGLARIDQIFDNITVAGRFSPILGRSLVVRQNPDPGRSGANPEGARIACGVIGVARRVGPPQPGRVTATR